MLDAFFFLAIGLGITIVLLRANKFRREMPLHAFVFFAFFLVCWNSVSMYLLRITLEEGYENAAALRNNSCDAVEGQVHVISKQPEGGHAIGDQIRIADRKLEISYYDGGLGYRKSIKHGGALTEGIWARLHVRDGNILKVEIRD